MVSFHQIDHIDAISKFGNTALLFFFLKEINFKCFLFHNFDNFMKIEQNMTSKKGPWTVKTILHDNQRTEKQTILYDFP